MAYLDSRNYYLTINGLKILVRKVEVEKLDVLTFEFEEIREQRHILYELYGTRAQVNFEFDYDKYAGFKFEGWITEFDIPHEKYNTVSMTLEIGKFHTLEKKNAEDFLS